MVLVGAAGERGGRAREHVLELAQRPADVARRRRAVRIAGESAAPDPPAREGQVQRRARVGAELDGVVPAAGQTLPFPVGRAAVAERRPRLVAELEVDLRVRAHAHRPDHVPLGLRQSRAFELDVAQRAERQRQHDQVGGLLDAPARDVEHEPDRAGRRARGSPTSDVVVPDRAGRQLADHARRRAGRCRRRS